MASMLVCWVVCPALLGALSLGCGLALEKASGRRLPTALLLPSGFALLIVLAGIPVAIAPLAKLATPLVVLVAVVGLFVGELPRDRHLGRPVLLAVVILLVFGAPVILSGEATFLGFGKLDDTSTWLGITDWVMSHGRDVSGLAPSTYEFMLKNYVGSGYPVGSFLPLGIAHVLLRQDVAWLFQPTISFMGAMLGLALYGVVEPLMRSPLRRGLIAVVGAQSALLIGYAWWGSIKEVAAAALIALTAALAGRLLRGPAGLRELLPLAVTVAAFGAVYSIGGIVWLAPALIPPLAVLLWRRRHAMARALRRVRALVLVAVALLLLLPILVTITRFAGPAAAQFSTTQDLGILSKPLSAFQALGIWPAGDPRSSPVNGTATGLLLALVVLLGITGLWLAWRRRGWELLLYALVSLVSGGLIFVLAGPWVGAKALALAAPAAPVCALTAAAIAYERGRRPEGIVLAGLVAGGVLWSNLLQYHAVDLAPRGQLLELSSIAPKIKGQGPTLLTNGDNYAGRHFLRAADPESVSDLRRRVFPLRNGQIAPLGSTQDLDSLLLENVLLYRTLVLRTSPVASRPPYPYRLLWRGQFYEVWQRPASFRAVLAHLPLGNFDDPSGIAPCGQILALAKLLRVKALAYVPRDQIIRIPLANLALPFGWTPSRQYPDLARLGSAGSLTVPITVSHGAPYHVWVGNSFRALLEVLVDGRRVGQRRQALNAAGAYSPFGAIPLTAGRHTVTLDYSGPNWRPGSGGSPPLTGPVALNYQSTDQPVQLISPGSARQLCGKRLDWVEALG